MPGEEKGLTQLRLIPLAEPGMITEVRRLSVNPSCAILVALIAAYASGCESFRYHPLDIPEGLEGVPAFTALRSSEPSPDHFDEAFPPVRSFIMISRVVAQRRRFLGKTVFNLSMRVGETGLIRMLGRHPGDATVLFDLFVGADTLQVYVPSAGTLFQGNIAEEGSPFGARFGVEPWDLTPIILIGRRLGASEFTVLPGQRVRTLVMSPRDIEADGLVRVEVESASGLPRSASWERGRVRWTVQYLAWAIVGDESEPEGVWLMPSRFVIRRSRPRVQVEVSRRSNVQQYRINPTENRSVFQIPVLAGTGIASLEELADALEGK